MNSAFNVSTRRAELQQQCALQRDELSACVDGIEAHCQRTDKLFGLTAHVLNRPAVWIAGAALLLSVMHVGWWSRITRGLMLLSSARRLYGLIQQ